MVGSPRPQSQAELFQARHVCLEFFGKDLLVIAQRISHLNYVGPLLNYVGPPLNYLGFSLELLGAPHLNYLGPLLN